MKDLGENDRKRCYHNVHYLSISNKTILMGFLLLADAACFGVYKSLDLFMSRVVGLVPGVIHHNYSVCVKLLYQSVECASGLTKETTFPKVQYGINTLSRFKFGNLVSFRHRLFKPLYDILYSF